MIAFRVASSITEIDRDPWNACFPGKLEDYDYLLAVEQAGLAGFDWRYVVVEEYGKIVAATPGFLTAYALDSTLTGAQKTIMRWLRAAFPKMLTPRLACLGSPCTETGGVGIAREGLGLNRMSLLAGMVQAFEVHADREGCALVGVKDIAEPEQPAWEQALGKDRFEGVPGLPVATLDIDFPNIDAYLARLSRPTRSDMRRKLRSRAQLRIERRHDLAGIRDRIMLLYRQTRARAEMQFEDLPATYFDGVLAAMGERAFMVLYYAGDELLAANLLLHDRTTLLDKFFCMDAERGRAHNLYFVSWFENLSYCLAHGLKHYQSGQAAYANKLRLGSRLTRTQMYFRHRNRIFDRALRLAAPLLAPEPAPRTK